MASPALLSVLLLPAAAYLDAKHRIRDDLHFLRCLVQARISNRISERRDRVNAFYYLEEAAHKNPYKAFLWFQGREYTYKEAYELTLRYATWLKETHGIKKHDVVALDYMNKPGMLWLTLGLWALGAKPAYINYNLKGAALVHSVKVSSTGLVIIDPDVQSNSENHDIKMEIEDGMRKEGRNVHCLVLDPTLEETISHWRMERPDDKERSGELPHHMAVLIYTSGTTGLPKPAMVSWWKANGSANFLGLWMGLQPTDRYLTAMPLYHSTATVFGFMACLRANITLCLSPKFSATRFFQEARDSKATIIQYVGETCRYLLDTPPSPADKQHSIRIAYGNGLRPDIWQKFRDRFAIPTIVEFYGATECHVAFWNRNTGDYGKAAVGTHGTIMAQVLGSKIRILKIDLDTEEIARNPSTNFCIECQPGEPGELIAKLDPAEIEKEFQGYYGNAAASNTKLLRDVFVKGDAWFRTGDLFRHTSDGHLFFQDRLGETYRFRSENISTTEVSNTLNASPHVSDSCVYGVKLPSIEGAAGVGAFVPHSKEKNGVSQQTLDDILTHLQGSLGRSAIPSFLRVVDHMETTGNNKIVKNKYKKVGVNPDAMPEGSIYWLQGGRYVPFRGKDYAELMGGRAKL